MKKLFYGIAILPFLGGIALAQPANQVASVSPVQLTGNQMDKVTAGFGLQETDVSNTSITLVSVYGPALEPCEACFLSVSSPAISVQSIMLSGVVPATTP
jgi:hypothetical protein